MFRKYDSDTYIGEEYSNSKSNVSQAYSKIIQLTYYEDRNMMKDLEQQCIGFDSKVVITMNRFSRLDTTFLILRHKSYSPSEYDILCDRYLTTIQNNICIMPEYVFESVDSIIDSDLKTIIENLIVLKDLEDRITDMEQLSSIVKIGSSNILDQILDRTGTRIDINRLSEYSKKFYRMMWEYNLELVEPKDIIETIWSASVILPLHSWILEVMMYATTSNVSNTNFILGEYDKTEIEFLFDGVDNLSEYVMTEYASHSLLFVHNTTHIYAYDPDDQNVFCPESMLLQRKFIGTAINPQIQTITNDIYCIYHSLFAMIDFGLINANTNSSDFKNSDLIYQVDRFESYQNIINTSQKLSVLVKYRIADLLQRYPITKK